MAHVPPLLRKILTTTLSGGATLTITLLSKQQTITSINLSVLVGGVALLIEFLLEFEARVASVEATVEARTKDMQRIVDEGFVRVGKATELFERLRKSQLGNGAMTQLVDNASGLGTDSPAIVLGFAQRELLRTAKLLRDLQTDQAAYDGEDHDWLLTLTHSAGESIDAISTAVDIGFWSTELGRRYFDAQRTAVSRGVPVRRVFVLQSADEQTVDEIHRVAHYQASQGVNVKIVAVRDLPTQARRPMSDFILFDGGISYEVSSDAVGGPFEPMVASTMLVLSPQTLTSRKQRFAYLWDVAQSVTQPTP
ncbi:phospholipase D-like domain-containing protein [Kitasatospora azatica]|uniref:hypothetical protein n=1 Tax=Kitasatospora azatica TaxID=58347 RepID=UPI00056427C4|nr:hypothetical protein [Kitasatospora azatica]